MKSYVFTTARGWNLGRYSRKYYPVSKQRANHAIDPRIVRRGGQGILCSKRSLEIGFYWIISNELDDQNFRVKNTREITTHVIVSRLNVFAISNSLFDAITFFLFFFFHAGIFDVQHPLCIQILPPVYWRYSRA